MRLRQMWILGLCLSWSCAPAQAAPFRDGPAGNEDDHGASSRHSKENKLSKDGGRFDGIWQVSVGSLPPGLEKKGDFLPAGLAKNDDFFPPGLVDKGDFLPAGLARNHDFFPPADLAGEVGLIPEPTGLLLFGCGLLLAGASERRRRSS